MAFIKDLVKLLFECSKFLFYTISIPKLIHLFSFTLYFIALIRLHWAQCTQKFHET